MSESELIDTSQPTGHADSDRSVTPFELFFDLVFVFSFTQVTLLLAADLSWERLGGGLLILAALWLAWQSYAWLGTAVALDEGGVRLAMLAVMTGMLTVALATPSALEGNAVLFAAAYGFVRVMMLVLYAASVKGDARTVRALSRLVPSATVGPGLILAGAVLNVGPFEAWIAAALVLEFGSMFVMDMSGWKVSAGHFAERHGLIFIVALGEAVISIGVGAAGLPLNEEVVLPAALGLAVIVGLWWVYFDRTAQVAEHMLSAASGAARGRLARDAYSYIHLPMITGAILFSLGVKKTLAHAYDPLPMVAAAALCGGIGLYLIAQVGFPARSSRSFELARLVAAVACFGLIWSAGATTALFLLSAVAAILALLVGYETLFHPRSRRRNKQEEGASPRR